MPQNEDILKSLDESYQLIPMKDITDEARALAVRWCENYRPSGSIDLPNKHKLASDIMNYARHYAKDVKRKLIWEMIEEWQDAREPGENLNERRWSFSDIEADLYGWLEKIDPKSLPQSPQQQ